MANRVFVGFSSTDQKYFNIMKAWKEHENIDFDFIDLQVDQEIDSENETYIKSILRKKINLSGTFIQIIGENTKYKYKYVKWEAEVALEKECRIIGVNINGLMSTDNNLTPKILKNTGSLFIAFNREIIKYALDNFKQQSDKNWRYNESTYNNLGIENDGKKIYK